MPRAARAVSKSDTSQNKGSLTTNHLYNVLTVSNWHGQVLSHYLLWSNSPDPLACIGPIMKNS